MILSVYRPCRKVNGKTTYQRGYWGQYRMETSHPIRRLSLHTTDRHVAIKRLTRIVLEIQQEEEGLVPPRALRIAAATPIGTHIDRYIADLEARGNGERYLYNLERMQRHLMRECGWSRLADITAMSFEEWRTRQHTSAKTLNDYLDSVRGLCRWLRKRGLLLEDPLQPVCKVRNTQAPRRPRRAFTPEDMRRLLPCSEWRMPMYLMAFHTGLRRGELAAIKWRDINLDTGVPFVDVRASLSKNRKRCVIPLHADVVNVLLGKRHQDQPDANAPVFRSLVGMKLFRCDLFAAGLVYRDEQGQYLDFHSFRHGFCTELAVAGVDERTRMSLMRHSDSRLTNLTYVDCRNLPMTQAIRHLPSVLGGLPELGRLSGWAGDGI